jgi:hypothetical protein
VPPYRHEPAGQPPRPGGEPHRHSLRRDALALEALHKEYSWTNFMTHSGSTLPTKPRMSASNIHFTGIRSMDTVRAEIGTRMSARPPLPTAQRWALAVLNPPSSITRGLITAESAYP